jgi:hypothetical protein
LRASRHSPAASLVWHSFQVTPDVKACFDVVGLSAFRSEPSFIRVGWWAPQ